MLITRIGQTLSFAAVCVHLTLTAKADEPAPGPAAVRRSEKPASLRAAEDARAAHRLRTGWLEVVEHVRLGGAPQTRFRSWRCASDDVIIVDHGDQDGVVQRDGATGLPSTLDYSGPRSFLVQGDQIWWHDEDSPLARVLPRERRDFFNLWDFRRMGIDLDTPGESIEERAAALGVETEWSEGNDGELDWVRNESEGGAVTWWIDPARDWNVVRTATDVLGKRVVEARYTLERIDGVWFPVRSEIYDLDVDPVRPTRTAEITRAEFNRPEHLERFTPADVGIEPGTQVSFLSPDPSTGPQGPMWWDGSQLLRHSEYRDRVDRGEVAPGPTVVREWARLRARTAARALAAEGAQPSTATTQPALIDPLGEWERYTLGFIERHRLDDGQRERALAILRDCRELGNGHLARVRERIARWEERRASLSGPSTSTQPAGLAGDLEHERRVLLEPLDRIFEERLKPRLDALLTSEQRRTADEPAASAGHP